MLTAKLGMQELRRAPIDWKRHAAISDSGFRFGESQMTKFDTQFLAFGSKLAEHENWFWVTELDDELGSHNECPVDHETHRGIEGFQSICISVSSFPDRLVEISRSAGTGCAIYLAATESSLTLSWQFETVAEALPSCVPHKEACERYLEFGPKPVRQQIIEGVYMLWPGEKCTLGPDGLTFEEAHSRPIVQSGTLREDARVTDAFLAVLAQTMRSNLKAADNPIIELSGGLDSACVAIAALQVRHDLRSFAAIQQGAIGLQQLQRRQELLRLTKFQDATAPSDTIRPFAALELEECTVTPMDDIFRMSCMAALDQHSANDIDLVLTGIGGDELTMENTIGRESWEVRSTISSSANDAAAGRADMYLRRGIWLCQPLTARSVVDFCRALPQSIRQARRLNLLTLARAGLSDGFLFPRLGEHFGTMTLYEASIFDFDAAFSESVLADYRFFNLDELLSNARRATISGFDLQLVTKLWFALKLERVLQRYC